MGRPKNKTLRNFPNFPRAVPTCPMVPEFVLPEFPQSCAPGNSLHASSGRVLPELPRALPEFSCTLQS